MTSSFGRSRAVRTARAWMKRRVAAGQPALTGMFARDEATYVWPRPDAMIGSDREPVFAAAATALQKHFMFGGRFVLAIDRGSLG